MAAPYPLNRSERIVLRADLLRAEMNRAEMRVAHASRSVRCSGGQWSEYPPKHAGMDDGCRDDGTGCLCACHDRGA